MSTTDPIFEALTFDDVLLLPARSDVLPRDVDLRTRLTNKITLNIPLVSAAMDTVTDSRLAIALAQEGGIGIIHKNLTVEEQALEVDRVKRSQSGIITDPFKLNINSTLQDAENLMARYHVSGVPITDENGGLVGILTNRDLRFEEDFTAPVASAMTPQDRLVTVPPGTTLEEAKKLMHKHRIEKIPIVDAGGKLKGLLTIKDIVKAKNFPLRCTDEHGRLRVGAALGVGDGELERAAALIAAGVDVIVVDSAHGHSVMVLQTVRALRDAHPDMDIIAGNIVTPEAARDLIDSGVSTVKVGVGPGSICTTRVVAGVGMPQFTAVKTVVEECRKHNVPVISDGGIKYSGDIAKALAAGADCVMIGSLFAGTAESPGDTLLYEGRSYKVVRGMGSIKAMQKGSKTRYMQFDDEPQKLVPEGIEARVPYRGSLSDNAYQLVGGVRASMGYCGCKDIPTFQREARFVKVTSAGLRESHPHDVTITEDAPNYQAPR